MDLKKGGTDRFVQLLNRLIVEYHVGEVILAEEDIKVNTTGLTNFAPSLFLNRKIFKKMD